LAWNQHSGHHSSAMGVLAVHTLHCESHWMQQCVNLDTTVTYVYHHANYHHIVLHTWTYSNTLSNGYGTFWRYTNNAPNGYQWYIKTHSADAKRKYDPSLLICKKWTNHKEVISPARGQSMILLPGSVRLPDDQ